MCATTMQTAMQLHQTVDTGHCPYCGKNKKGKKKKVSCTSSHHEHI